MSIAEFKVKKLSKEDIVYIIAIILMIIPIVLVIINPGSVGKEVREFTSGGIGPFGWGAKKGQEVVEVIHESPFGWDGLAAVFGCILYAVVLMRNRNTLYQFNKDTLNFKVLFLHLLNLLFLISAMSLFTKNNWHVFNLSPAYFMIAAIALSAVSMRTLSGYMWIVTIILAMFNIDVFNKWQGYSTIYTVSAYASLLCQVLILNIFDFDIQTFINDFSAPARIVKQDVNSAINTTMGETKKVASAVNIASGKVINSNLETKKESIEIQPVRE